jgi:CheY-like chemotaxis protein
MPSYALLIPVEGENRSKPIRVVPEPKKSTSLLVEDERMPREEISGLLEKRNFRVRPAQSGHEAIDLANEIGPSVVLMDIDLGGDDFDGITAAGEILRLQPASSIIFITAHFNNLTLGCRW